MLSFLSPPDRGHYRPMPLDVDEVGYIVLGGESGEGVRLVLEYSLLDVASQTDVEDTTLAGRM